MTNLQRMVASALLVVPGCSNPAPPLPEMAARSPDYALGPAVRQLVAGAHDDVLGIARTFETVIDEATFLLADFGNDRILRLDTSFALLNAFGRSGSGPGELKGPSKALPWNDLLVVGDWNNSRFGIYDRAGHYLRSIAAPRHPDSFGMLADGRILLPSAQPTHYATILAGDGTTTPFAARPATLMADSDTETLGGGASVILVAAGDTTHILDNEWGVLLKYDPDGHLVLARSIPADILESLRSFRTELVDGLADRGHRVVGAPLLKTMSFADNGAIVIMITHGSTVALIVDPHDYSARRVTAPLDDPDYALVRSATSVLIHADDLFVFSSTGLASFPLSGLAR